MSLWQHWPVLVILSVVAFAVLAAIANLRARRANLTQARALLNPTIPTGSIAAASVEPETPGALSAASGPQAPAIQDSAFTDAERQAWHNERHGPAFVFRTAPPIADRMRTLCEESARRQQAATTPLSRQAPGPAGGTPDAPGTRPDKRPPAITAPAVSIAPVSPASAFTDTERQAWHDARRDQRPPEPTRPTPPTPGVPTGVRSPAPPRRERADIADKPMSIRYRDQAGAVTDRMIVVTGVEGKLTGSVRRIERLTAWCHLRQDNRTFLRSGIVAAGDGETGEIIFDLEAYLLRRGRGFRQGRTTEPPPGSVG